MDNFVACSYLHIRHYWPVLYPVHLLTGGRYDQSAKGHVAQGKANLVRRAMTAELIVLLHGY